MLTDEQKELFGEVLVPIFQELEQYILEDIVRRLKKEERFTETAELEAEYLRKLGYSPYKIRLEVFRMLKADKDYVEMIERNTHEEKAAVQAAIDQAKAELKELAPELYAQVGNMAFNNDLHVWQEAGEALIRGSAVDKYIKAMQRRGTDELLNLTRTLAFRSASGSMIPARKAFTHAMNRALTQVTSGAVSYGQAIRDAVKELTASGLRHVEYASGRTMQIDAACRNAVLTASSQLAGDIMQTNIEETGVPMVQVSSHWGARPSHAVWQGGIYTLQQFRNICGYGEPGNPEHIYSYHCRHNHYPYWPGVSEPLEYEPEPGPFEINGRTYTYYQATQKQRQMERQIRKLKLDSVYAGENNREQIKLKMAAYKDFSKKTGIRAKLERCQVVGYDKGSPVPGGGKIKPVSGLDILSGLGYSKEVAEFKALNEALAAKENFIAMPNSIAARTHKEKFVGYFLNREHPKGGSKARLFESILGYNTENWNKLSDALFDGLQTSPVTTVEETKHGVKYTVNIPVTGLLGKKADVHTVWQIDNGTNMPRIITAYPLKETAKEI